MGVEVPDGDIGASIFLVRHGETALNKENKLRGWKDVPLNEEGFKQAKDLGKIFKELEKIDKIYESNLLRVVQTSKSIEDEFPDAKVIKTKSLRPINFGDWNGEPMDDVQPKMLKLQKDWEEDPDKKAPNGESFNEYQDRQISIFTSIIENAKAGEKIVISAHLRNCVWILGYVMNSLQPIEGEDLSMLSNITQKNGHISVLHYNPKTKQVQINSVNTNAVDPEHKLKDGHKEKEKGR